jgi:phosphoribosylamine--glycine ligase
MERKILDLVINPTLAGLRQDGINYTGFLYAGLMITADGTPKVIEYNCRMGDPETQPIMVRLNTDLVALCKATIDGRLAEQQADWDPRAALGVVMAAGGYPAAYDHFIERRRRRDQWRTRAVCRRAGRFRGVSARCRLCPGQ